MDETKRLIKEMMKSDRKKISHVSERGSIWAKPSDILDQPKVKEQRKHIKEMSEKNDQKKQQSLRPFDAIVIATDSIKDMALELCYEIEKLPANKQQTVCSEKASKLHAEICTLKAKINDFYLVSKGYDLEQVEENGKKLFKELLEKYREQ